MYKVPCKVLCSRSAPALSRLWPPTPGPQIVEKIRASPGLLPGPPSDRMDPKTYIFLGFVALPLPGLSRQPSLLFCFLALEQFLLGILPSLLPEILSAPSPGLLSGLTLFSPNSDPYSWSTSFMASISRSLKVSFSAPGFSSELQIQISLSTYGFFYLYTAQAHEKQFWNGTLYN